MKWKVLFSYLLFANFISAQALLDSTVVIDQLHVDYAVNQFLLSTEQQLQIDQFLDQKYLNDLSVNLQGYADNDGSEAFNLELSQKRNQHLAHYLNEKGISSQSISMISYGEEKISSDETSADVKQKNRRVSIQLKRSQKFKQFKGFIVSEDSLTRLIGKVILYANGRKQQIQTDREGNFSLAVPVGQEVELYFTSEGHYPTRKEIKLAQSSKTEGVPVPLAKLDQGLVFQTNLEFIRGKAILLKDSKNEMEILTKFLKENPEICIEIGGHVYARKSIKLSRKSVKFGLSIARALELYNHFRSENISTDRMYARGYGNSNLLYPDARDFAEASANRRVEIKVVSCERSLRVKNDSVADLQSYRVIERAGLGKLYNPETVEEDLKDMVETIKRQIIEQIAFMENNDEEASKFTYLQIFNKFKDRQFRKSKKSKDR